MDFGCCRLEGALVLEKEIEKSGMHRGMHKESTSPKRLVGKTIRTDILEFL